MHPTDDSSDHFTEEVRRFIAAHRPAGWTGLAALPPTERDHFVDTWRRQTAEAGLLATTWPEEFGGRGLGAREAISVQREFARARVPFGGPHDGFGIRMLGNTLLRHGTAEQCAQLLPRILDGSDKWCQGFSEPDSGSDLASACTVARRVSGGYTLHGSKTWTSWAHTANRIFVLARLDDAEPGDRHARLVFLLASMNDPGLSIHPVRMMNGSSHFNQVFFDGVVVDDTDVVGAPGEGWRVATTLLSFERGESAAALPFRFHDEFDRVRSMVVERGADGDPKMRVRLAAVYERLFTMSRVGEQFAMEFGAGDIGGEWSAVFKVLWTEYHVALTDLTIDLFGADALVLEGESPITAFQADDPAAANSSASWVGVHLTSRAGPIYAGTNEIQRNIIGERILGLPR